MDVINNFTHIPRLFYYSILAYCASEPDWFLETCETPLEIPTNIATFTALTVSTLQVTLHTLTEIDAS